LSNYKNLSILDTLALAFFKNDSLKEAIVYAENALKKLPANTPTIKRKSYEDNRAKYEKALKEKNP